jgi:hypothetical protein
MVIAQITGGLGNQLFQYAAAKSLSLHHNVPLSLEVSSFYRKELPELEVPRDFELFNFTGITEKIISVEELSSLIDLKKTNVLPKMIIPAYRKDIYTEPYYHFDKNFFKSKKKVFLKGGWQSEKYFKSHENEIRNNLHLKDALVERVLEKANTLKIETSVAVHIRRGDYLRKKIIYEWHGVMDKEYYTKAFELLKSKTNASKAYYFTDDVDWVSENLLPLFDGEIISGNITKSHYEDLYLMSQCKHNIIANSSFSWWGAWLNGHKDKIVIAPKKWFGNGPKDTQDIIPEGWHKV